MRRVAIATCLYAGLLPARRAGRTTPPPNARSAA